MNSTFLGNEKNRSYVLFEGRFLITDQCLAQGANTGGTVCPPFQRLLFFDVEYF